MEASALRAPSLTRVPLSSPLLRLRSDEQLLALFRAGNDDAFGTIHDRYRQRLFAYVRQMLSPGSRQDAEDVMQDVFVRAYGALRADSRDVNLRAWLYRVAHNRCIDHLRRPTPPPAEIFEMSRRPLHDPIEEAQRRDDLARLVEDVGRLPEQQRSALLMREIDGMSYADLAAALDVTVPAVKSLLVRARVGLVEAAEARDADCCEIREDLLASYDRGVKASGRARRHMRSCSGCSEYRTALRGMRRSFAALSPVSAGIGGIAANLLGLGGSGAAVGGSAAAGGGGAAAVGGGLATATACKVAAVVCTAALTAGGAVEVSKLRKDRSAAEPAAAAAIAPAVAAPGADLPAALPEPALLHRTGTGHPVATPAERRAKKERAERKAAAKDKRIVRTTPVAERPAPATSTPVQPVTAPVTDTGPAGGVAAPEEPAGSPSAGATQPQAGAPDAGAAPSQPVTPPADQPATQTPPATGDPDGPPPSEH